MDIIILFFTITITFFAIGLLLSFFYSILPEQLKFLKLFDTFSEDEKNED
jgi:hypothetical protein